MKKHPDTRLRAGYTTGACAAAAARGAALMLRDQRDVDEVTLQLPAGVSATFRLEGRSFDPANSSCFVVKDAGDDPDITNGAEVHACVTLSSASEGKPDLVITGGAGIGKATKPGLAVAPGEWAINPVPRRMITEAVRAVIPDRPLEVKISIPDGELRAQKTLNARLGILGGLSILGTTGIVRPVSAKAWTDTIDTALDVARACGCETVVFSTGRSSEMAAQNQRPLPEEAYVMMGDHVAHALRSARQRGFTRPVIACQFAKLVKIACGYENTHAAASEMDLRRLGEWVTEAELPRELITVITTANTAREIAIRTGFDAPLLELVSRKASEAARLHAADINPVFMVADYSGRIVFNSPELYSAPSASPR